MYQKVQSLLVHCEAIWGKELFRLRYTSPKGFSYEDSACNVNVITVIDDEIKFNREVVSYEVLVDIITGGQPQSLDPEYRCLTNLEATKEVVEESNNMYVNLEPKSRIFSPGIYPVLEVRGSIVVVQIQSSRVDFYLDRGEVKAFCDASGNNLTIYTK